MIGKTLSHFKITAKLGEDERPQQNLSVVLGFDTVIESLARSH